MKLINPYALSYLKYIKYFENGGKNMSFMVKDNNVLDKYKIMDEIEEVLSIKFHSKPAYDKTYIKAKIRELMA